MLPEALLLGASHLPALAAPAIASLPTPWATSHLLALDDSTATFVAGGASKLFRDMLLFPVDTWKVREQASVTADLRGRSGGAGSAVGLYSGILPILLTSIPAGGAYFAANRAALLFLSPYVGTGLTAASGAAVASAIAYWTLRTPAELLKTRAQVGGDGLGFVVNARSYIDAEGPGVLFRGLGTTLVRSIPFEVCRLTTIAWLQSADGPLGPEAAIAWASGGAGAFLASPSERAAAAGFLASGGASVVTQPLDTIKTLIQARRGAAAAAGGGAGEDAAGADGPGPATAWARAGAEIVSDGGGPAALWAGGVPRALSCAFSGALIFGVYGPVLEAVRQF